MGNQYNFGAGYIEPSTTGTSYQYRYYMKDHLGNNRVVSNLSGTILQTNHYYPYGANIACSTNSGRQQYKYNGKELDRTHGLNCYDYLARQYDAALGQFTSMDPLCEKYYHISPYVYCGGNPVSRVDPDGRYIAWFENDGFDNYKEWIYNSERKAFCDTEGNVYTGEKLNVLSKALNELYECGEEMKQLLDDSSHGVLVSFGGQNGENNLVEDYLNVDNKIVSQVTWSTSKSIFEGTPTVSLGHELAHSYDRIHGITNIPSNPKSEYDGNCEYVPDFEKYAVHIENKIRAHMEVPLRYYYYQDYKGNGIGDPLVGKDNQSLYFDINGNVLKRKATPYKYK